MSTSTRRINTARDVMPSVSACPWIGSAPPVLRLACRLALRCPVFGRKIQPAMKEQASSGAEQDRSMEQAKTQFLTMRLIHFALVAGLAIFGGVTLIITGKDLSLTPSFENPMTWVAVIVCVLTLAVSAVVHLAYPKAGATTDIAASLQKYLAFCLVRWAIIEGGALFLAVATLLTRNVLPIGLFAVSLAMLIFRHPSPKEFLSLTSAGAPRPERSGRGV